MNFDPNPMLENRAPKEEVRIESLTVEPQPDGRRIRVSLLLTPFRERPNLEFTILDGLGIPLSTVSVVEALDFRMSITMHLRSQAENFPLVLTARVHYPDLDPVDEKTIEFDLTPPASPAA